MKISAEVSIKIKEAMAELMHESTTGIVGAMWYRGNVVVYEVEPDLANEQFDRVERVNDSINLII